MKNLVIIGGPPGSGKTTVSRLLEQQGFVRLEIDQFYQKAPRNPAIQHWFEDSDFLDSAYTNFKQELLKNLQDGKRVVVETTGVSNRWNSLLNELEPKYTNERISMYLQTSQDVATKRVQERNETDYPIKMTKEALERFFKREKYASQNYQHVINADQPLVTVFDSVLSLVR